MHDEFENQLDEIRINIYEQTKNMTNAEAAEQANRTARKLSEQYGFKIISRINQAQAV